MVQSRRSQDFFSLPARSPLIPREEKGVAILADQ